MQVKTLIDRFLEWHAEHSKPATVKFYHQALGWVHRKFGGREWQSLEREDLREAMRLANRRADGTPFAPDTQRRNIIGISQLQKFAADQYDLEIHLRPKDLKKPSGKRREAIPTEEELEKIFESAGGALELAFRSLAQSGMRPNELVRATIADLNPERDLLILKDHKTATKTGRPRRIPLGETMQRLVLTAIGGRESGQIWLDETGKGWTVGKLSRLFSKVRDRLGLNQDLVLYSFRHYKGTQVVKKYDIHKAAIVLGHSQVSTTARYAHPDDDDARLWQE